MNWDLNTAKNFLIPLKISEAQDIAEKAKATVKVLPTKLVAVKKKKPNEPIKFKSRIVARGNYDESEDEKDTYAGGADATAVRTAIRIAALRKYVLRTKDVSTAFLNAEHGIKGQLLLLKPPAIYVKAGLVGPDDYWLVKKAIYGLKESPLLWSKERDVKVSKTKIKMMCKEDPTVEVEYFLKKIQGDPNLEHFEER